MSDLGLIWLSTVVTVVATSLLFVRLAQWSAGGPAPWSIAAGMAHGISDWASDGPDPLRSVSPQAVELTALELDPRAVASLRRPPAPARPDPPPAAEVEELWTRHVRR